MKIRWCLVNRVEVEISEQRKVGKLERITTGWCRRETDKKISENFTEFSAFPSQNYGFQFILTVFTTLPHTNFHEISAEIPKSFWENCRTANWSADSSITPLHGDASIFPLILEFDRKIKVLVKSKKFGTKNKSKFQISNKYGGVTWCKFHFRF